MFKTSQSSPGAKQLKVIKLRICKRTDGRMHPILPFQCHLGGRFLRKDVEAMAATNHCGSKAPQFKKNNTNVMKARDDNKGTRGKNFGISYFMLLWYPNLLLYIFE